MLIRYKIVLWSHDKGERVIFYLDESSFGRVVVMLEYLLDTKYTNCYIISVSEAEEDDSEAWKSEE